MAGKTYKLTTLVFLLSCFTVIASATTLPIQPPNRYVRPRPDNVLTRKSRNFITEKSTDSIARIWVFFTDRGISTNAEFQTAASELSDRITQRALKRREKVGKAAFTIIDVPVNPEYVQAVESKGAKLRHVSRYLNAASFEIRLNRLDKIAGLPFIAEIKPVLAYRKDYPVELKNDGTTDENKNRSPSDLNYGDSYGQLNQINVIEAHNHGYSGAGVLVAMFDTGFRTSHRAFSKIMTQNRLIAAWDFVFDDPVVENDWKDTPSAWSHGTKTWSTLGGSWPANLHGPAYGADFILAKTEDVRSEFPVEEDNWVAAVEWADSIGADVISSSLGYTDWYEPSDFDGNTATTTIAADMAAEYGIVVCNSAGNGGPSASTLGAPADADSIITVGAVQSSGIIASFSSRGPTADGRIKPEVCAQGYATVCAGADDDYDLTTANGTSLSCPLIGGVAALVLEANPDWTPMQVREAIMMTADRAGNPDNTYGWGIADAWAAMNYCFEDQPYVSGDADGSGYVDIDDTVYVITYIFSGGMQPCPLVSADADGAGGVDIDDVVYLINYIFGGGPPPAL